MPAPFSVSLLLLPGFSLLSLGAVRSVFAAANEQAGIPLYRLRQFVADGVAALAQCGMSVSAEPLTTLDSTAEGMILLLADELVDERQASRIGEHLARLIDRRDGSEPLVLGAVGAAAHLMAQQGLLDGYRAAIHWQILADAVQTFSRTVFSTNVFEIDRDRVSCAGGTTTLDLLLHWLGLRHGSGFAAELAASLGVERLRNSDERQPLPTSAQPVVGSARIKEALALMEANLSEPLQADDIARLVGVSRRQLERLFRQHLEALPSRYYLELRLKHARRQLKQTTQSILQVGLASGFASGSHFSTAYRNCFGYTPREERARRMMPQAGTNESGENDQ